MSYVSNEIISLFYLMKIKLFRFLRNWILGYDQLFSSIMIEPIFGVTVVTNGDQLS